MANGSTATSHGSAEIEGEMVTKNDYITAKAAAILMQMGGIDLLMGNDLIQQFGRLQIDYKATGNLITVGDIPIHAIQVDIEEETKLAVVNKKDCTLPPRSMVKVLSC